ncbi:Oidioi.mRNA.OKI2018_I69.PAR.g11319.t1.cds [Oikopleura dioica]|uniref:Oidioi.mRNA.OKI2018_I69.PAR.g11319.t1.cds n=1 Tax=Oikopleura dioica TaxID=34765 RepID=A0ABN7RZ92_OIKDI|nr:Oidioi.mRNA.OKI2018_I69.PAR.g11319.t1.cds [Oikopleura dioica]
MVFHFSKNQSDTKFCHPKNRILTTLKTPLNLLMEEKFADNESVLKCASLTEESAAKTVVAGIVTEVDPDLVIEEDVVEEIDVPVHLDVEEADPTVDRQEDLQEDPQDTLDPDLDLVRDNSQNTALLKISLTVTVPSSTSATAYSPTFLSLDLLHGVISPRGN